MELWFATLVIIVTMVAIGAVVARAWRPQHPDHGIGPFLAVRLVVVLVVSALAAAARVAARFEELAPRPGAIGPHGPGASQQPLDAVFRSFLRPGNGGGTDVALGGLPGGRGSGRS